MRPLPKRIFTRRTALKTTLAAAVVLPAHPRLAGAQGGELNIYNWDSYIDDETIPAFESETGTRVRYDLFASNDELFAKLRGGNPGYDLIFPSNDWVARMIAADMLMPIDQGKISNFGNIDDLFKDAPYDPGRAHALPYFWGVVGLGYNKTVGTPTSWADIFASDEYAGSIALQRENDSLMAALKYLGFSINTQDPAEIKEAEELLISIKSKIKTFAPDTGQDLLLSGEVDVCLEYNGDVLQVMEEDDDLNFVVPVEGSIRYEDDMCIPKGAPNPDAAHAFMNYVLDAEVGARLAEYILYPTPNRAAFELLADDIKTNEAIYPPREVLEKCEIQVYGGEEVQRMLDDAMTRVLSA